MSSASGKCVAGTRMPVRIPPPRGSGNTPQGVAETPWARRTGIEIVAAMRRTLLLLARLSRPPRGARLRRRMDHGDGPGRADLQRVVRGPARRRAGRRHRDLAQRLRPHPQRQRRRRQLRLPAPADERHASATASTRPATFAYYCQLHPTMRGDVAVHRLLLGAAKEPAAAGKPYALSGRAALPEGSTVSIEAGGAVAATAKVGEDGTFTASVTPRGDDDLHRGRRRRVRAARPGAGARPQGQRVADGQGPPRARRRAGHARRPPGATVVLQLKLKEHFGWWPTRTLKLDAHSRVRFSLPRGRKVSGARAADRVRRRDRARTQRHVPPTLSGMSRILVVGGGAIGGITAAKLDADVDRARRQRGARRRAQRPRARLRAGGRRAHRSASTP